MTREVRQIALYGKGGIGKSTVACNISASLAEMGIKVMHVGCSPKIDSTSFLHGGVIVEPNILEQSRKKGISEEAIDGCIVTGYRGILLAEAGGPAPAEGCAGRGVMVALDLLTKHKIFERYDIDFAIYDVIGDIVCGGFAQPMRAGYAKEVYMVTSGELMSLYSANNICIAIKTLSETKKAEVRLGGFINNMRGVTKERELMEEFAEILEVPVLAYIPRSGIVQEAEGEGGTVIEKRPNTELAKIYRGLAENIYNKTETYLPSPIDLDRIMELLRKYQAL